jgi:uncharacterized protein (TIGR00730 family)
MSTLQMLTVYLGSSGRTRPVFQQAAEHFGVLIGERGKKLVYGGMDAGLMGLLASKALESGAHVTGIIPKRLQDSERIHPHLTETLLVNDLWERKRRMFLAADAIIGLPGGYGTLDECLEVLYWGHLKLHDKPLVLVNIENYWGELIAYLRTLPDFDPRFLIVTDSVEGVFPALDAWTFEEEILEIEDGFPHFEADILKDTDAPIILHQASIQNTYHFITALGLKQLGKHQRPMGILNDKGQLDGFVSWIFKAAEERFITEKCLLLFSTAATPETLDEALREQKPVHIDLHREKWGERRKQPRDK